MPAVAHRQQSARPEPARDNHWAQADLLGPTHIDSAQSPLGPDLALATIGLTKGAPTAAQALAPGYAVPALPHLRHNAPVPFPNSCFHGSAAPTPASVHPIVPYQCGRALPQPRPNAPRQPTPAHMRTALQAVPDGLDNARQRPQQPPQSGRDPLKQPPDGSSARYPRA